MSIPPLKNSVEVSYTKNNEQINTPRLEIESDRESVNYLATMPPEIIQNTASYLDFLSADSLKHTCKHCAESIDNQIVRDCFANCLAKGFTPPKDA